MLTQKKLLPTIRPLDLTFWYAVVRRGGLPALDDELAGVVGDAAPTRCGGSLYLGVFPSAIAFTTWAYALTHADAGKFAQSTFLVPFITR